MTRGGVTTSAVRAGVRARRGGKAAVAALLHRPHRPLLQMPRSVVAAAAAAAAAAVVVVAAAVVVVAAAVVVVVGGGGGLDLTQALCLRDSAINVGGITQH